MHDYLYSKEGTVIITTSMIQRVKQATLGVFFRCSLHLQEQGTEHQCSVLGVERRSLQCPGKLATVDRQWVALNSRL